MKKNNKKIGVIYVISQARHKEGTTGNDLMSGKFEYKTCIKIGFTTNWENRSTQYKCNCVNTTVLFTISDKTITMEDEFRLHKYFRKYKVKDRRGKEWFDWSDEIIKFFQTHSIISDIREVLDSQRIFIGKSKVLKSSIDSIVNIISDVVYGGPDSENIGDIRRVSNILSNTYFLNEDDLFDYLVVSLGIEKDKVDQIREKYDRIEEDKKMFNSCMEEFNRRTEFPDKLRYICEEMGVSEEIKLRFLDIIPIQFKNAYLTLGPARCRALKYRRKNIEDEYNNMITQSSVSFQLDDLVYSTFKLKNRYTREFIKISLGNIYKQFGLTDTPKAIDIAKWFNIKDIRIQNKETGKRDAGYEIVSRKE